MTEATLKRTSGVLGCVYRHIGKNNPTTPARPNTPTIAEQYQTWFNQFSVWCEDRGKKPIPAEPEDVAAFLAEVSQSATPNGTVRARAAIAWHQRQHGYPSRSRDPEVQAETAHLEDKYPKPAGSTLKYTHEMELYGDRWQVWCHDQGIDHIKATSGQICDYINHLARSLSRQTVKPHIRAIRAIHEDPSRTTAAEVKEALTAVPRTNPAREQHSAARKEVDAEIQYILELASTEGVWANSIPPNLTEEQVARVMRAMTAANVQPRTFRQYVGHGWLPFKKWCEEMDISILTAQPIEIAAFLCQLADAISPTTADNARVGLAYCYSLCKSIDNPAKHLMVLTVVRGLRREKPKAASQVDPIRAEQYDLIRATAHNLRTKERPHQASLRGDVDIALIGTMRDGLLRKTEAADALWKHIEQLPDGGAALTIPFSKVDQTGEGATVYLSPQTMKDLQTMRHTMRQAGIEISEDDKIFRLSPVQVYRRIKEACDMAGLQGRYGGHSPRVGMLQDLTQFNTDLPKAMQAGRWKSDRMPAHYSRKLRPADNAVAQWHGRDRSPHQMEVPNPLSAYGLALPQKRARLEH